MSEAADDRGPIAGVGVPTLDRLIAVPREPRADESLLVRGLGVDGGGQVATALVAAARLGHPAALVGAVADDDTGAAVVAGLRDHGVDVEAVDRRTGARSAQSTVLVDRDGRRSILYDPGEGVVPELGTAARAIVAGCAGLLLERDGTATVAAARAARAHHAIVLLDADAYLAPALGELVPRCDAVIASQACAAALGEDPSGAVRWLRAAGARVAIVTCGAEGAVGAAAAGEGEPRWHREPAWPTEVVDTTGAGDVYHGAALVALVEGMPLDRVMRFAAIAAGLTCRAPGGRAGIPARAELDALL